MKALIFVETNEGNIYYKCDTFWSQSMRIQSAKIYNDNHQSQIDDWIISYGYTIHELILSDPSKLQSIVNKYHNSKLGYRTIDDRFLEDKFVANEETTDSDLGEKIYTHEMSIDGLNKPKFIDVRLKYSREEKLEKILK